MNKKPNIAVVSGGDSSEFVVSVKSAANVLKAIDTDKYSSWLVQMKRKEWIVFQDGAKIAEIDKSDFSFVWNGEKTTFDFAYITIHGTPGEDGILQGYFELLQIPYSTSNVHSSSLTFNKWHCNNYLRSFGVLMAKSMKIAQGAEIDAQEIVAQLGLPVFIKPNAGGSSFGITKVKTEDEIKIAVKKAWDEGCDALVEQFIEGQEFTCGIVKLKGKNTVFPITEVLSKNEFFDFDAKYTPGGAEEITPARLPKNLFGKCQNLTSEIYDLCGCSGIARIDFILKDNAFYFLEVNTTPGMTATSFIPQQIATMNLTLRGVITQIIEEKIEEY